MTHGLDQKIGDGGSVETEEKKKNSIAPHLKIEKRNEISGSSFLVREVNIETEQPNFGEEVRGTAADASK